MYGDLNDEELKKSEDLSEDSETWPYSYPCYTRFNFTGKSKSRLGRSNKHTRQTISNDDGKEERISSGGKNGGVSSQTVRSTIQPPKTPGISWLQRDSTLTNQFTPSTNSVSKTKNLGLADGKTSINDSGIDVSSQSNFLFNLKNDCFQNTSCKRNLGFNTPFKSQENHENIVKESNHFLAKLPLPKTELPSGINEDNKENTNRENKPLCFKEPSPFDPSYNQLKRISDAGISHIPVPTKNSETTGGNAARNHFGQTQPELQPLRQIIFAAQYKHNAFDKANEQKKDDDDTLNTPLDLSSAESITNKSIFSRSLSGGLDATLESSAATKPVIKVSDLATESKENEITSQKNSSDSLTSLLPKFLVATNKIDYKESVCNSSVVLNDSPPSIVSAAKNPFLDLFNKPATSNVDHNTCDQPIKTQLTPDSSQDNTIPKGDSSDDIAIVKKVQSLHQQNLETITLKEVGVSSNRAPFKLASPKLSLEDQLSSLSINKTNSVNSSNIEQANQNQNVAVKNYATAKFSPPDQENKAFQSLDFKSNKNIKAHNLPATEDFQKVMPENALIDKFNKPLTDLHKQTSHNLMATQTNQVFESHQGFTDQFINQDIFGKNQFPVPSNVEVSFQNCVNTNNINNQLKPQEDSSPCPQPAMLSNQSRGGCTPQFPQPQVPVATFLGAHGTNSSSEPAEKCCKPLPSQQLHPEQFLSNRMPVTSSQRPESVQPVFGQPKTYLAPPNQSNHRISNNDFPHVKPEVPQQMNCRPSFAMDKPQNSFKMAAPRQPGGRFSRANQELFVNGKAYTILSMLGRGGSSEVFQVLDPSTSKLLAVKCVDLSMVDRTIADGYLNEIDLLSKLQGCSSVIKMLNYEYVQEYKMLYVVMEKGDTDLSQLIRDISKTKKISMSMIIYYWTEMLTAVRDIHKQGIIHSDLKPANFLLVSGRLKLIDFGIASSQGDMTSVVKEVTTGTWNYMSPEALHNTSREGKGFKITYKSDVWSLGCILYNLVYGKTPFSHITNTWGKLQAIADPNHQIAFPEIGAPAVLIGALRSCLQRDVKQRPTVADLLALPYHSTGDRTDATLTLGRQIHTILPPEWWQRVSHLFPEIKHEDAVSCQDNKPESSSG